MSYFARGGLSVEVSAGFGGLEGLLASGGRTEEADAVAAVTRAPEVLNDPCANPFAAS